MVVFVIPIGAIAVGVICIVSGIIETRERNKILRKWGYRRKGERDERRR